MIAFSKRVFRKFFAEIMAAVVAFGSGLIYQGYGKFDLSILNTCTINSPSLTINSLCSEIDKFVIVTIILVTTLAYIITKIVKFDDDVCQIRELIDKSSKSIEGKILQSAKNNMIELNNLKDLNEHYLLATQEIEKLISEKGMNATETVRATCCYNIDEESADKSARDNYFRQIALHINKQSDIRYNVIFLKGDHKPGIENDFNESCHKEILLRHKIFFNRKLKNIKYGPSDGPYAAKRSRLHNRMEFLIIGNNIFVNIRTKLDDKFRLRYFKISDESIAGVFRSWFDSIWIDKYASHDIEYDEKRKQYFWKNDSPQSDGEYYISDMNAEELRLGQRPPRE